MSRATVFVSGPMFSAADKAQQLDLGEALEAAGYDAIVPHRDGIEVAPVLELLNDPAISVLVEAPIVDRCIAWVTRAIACLDMYWAVGSNVTVLNLDGRVPDEGSLVEATAAWLNGRPVIVYQTSPIRELGKNNNPMIGVISDWATTESTVQGVVEAVRGATAHAAHFSAPPALRVARVVRAGQAIAAMRGAFIMAVLDHDTLSVLEPDPALRAMCRYVLRQIIDFSKADTPEIRTKIILDGADGLHSWDDDPAARAALCSPIPC